MSAVMGARFWVILIGALALGFASPALAGPKGKSAEMKAKAGEKRAKAGGKQGKAGDDHGKAGEKKAKAKGKDKRAEQARRVHMKRMARIDRTEEVLKKKGEAAMAEKMAELREKEKARYARVQARLAKKGAEEEAAPEAGEVAEAPAPADEKSEGAALAADVMNGGSK